MHFGVLWPGVAALIVGPALHVMLATSFTGLIPAIWIAAAAFLCVLVSFAPARFGNRWALALATPALIVGVLSSGALIWQEFEEHDPDFVGAIIVPVAFLALGVSSLLVYRKQRRAARLAMRISDDNAA